MKATLRLLIFLLLTIALVAGGAFLGTISPQKYYAAIAGTAIISLICIAIGYGGHKKEK